jgi:iron(III) transport system substrate-binding protein
MDEGDAATGFSSGRRRAAGGLAALLLLPEAISAKVPPGYPRSYQKIDLLGRRERRLVIYSSADLTEVAELLRRFSLRYPEIKVDYVHGVSSDLYDRFTREVGAGRPSADLLLNSAMDQQIKLVNDGYAQAYASPEKPHLPPWAIWKNEAYGFTAEPIVMAYNKAKMPPMDVPRSHDSLERLLRTKPDLYRRKVITYDVERSGTGFLFLTQDLQVSRDTWKLVQSMGHVAPGLSISSGEMLRKVRSGEYWLAHNVMSSYAMQDRAGDPNLEIVYPSDYTLVMSRIAFIAKEARHPYAAKLFLDYLLSREGQALLAQRFMTPVRSDVAVRGGRVANASLEAIHVGPALLAGLDRLKYSRLIADWRRAIGR